MKINTGSGTFIVQGGEITSTMNGVEQNFPCSFPTQLLGFAISQSGASSAKVARIVHATKPTVSTFKLSVGGSTYSNGAYWIAVGQ